MIVFLCFLIGTFLTMALIPPLCRFAERRQLVDMPSPRKVHAVPVPRIGGVAMIAGATLPVIMWVPMDRTMLAYLMGVACIFGFGLWDDLKGLEYRYKLLGQLLAVLLVVVYGGVRIKAVPFLTVDPLPAVWSIPLTVFALIGITNALNLADGLDGLAGGIALLGLAVMAIIAHTGGGGRVELVAAAVVGSIVGFLRFNTHPARIFMGDAGSQFLGFSAGVLAVLLTRESNTAVSPAIPLLILGLPIFDTFLVIATRLSEGRSPFRPDRTHFHHRLLGVGFSHLEVVFLVYALQSVFVAAAYWLRYEQDWLVVLVYVTCCVALIVALRAATATGWRAHRRPSPAELANNTAAWLAADRRLLRIAFQLAVTAVTLFIVMGALFVESVPRDVGALAWGLLAVTIVLWGRHRNRQFSTVERACLYVAGICVVYLVQLMPGPLAKISALPDLLVVAIAVAVVIGFRFSRQRFRVTPMDFLVIFVALLVPAIPELGGRTHDFAVGAAKLVVLFYGIEMVLNNIGKRWDAMRYAMFVTYAVLGLRGMTSTLG